jgi:hypothetical protein
MTIKIKTQHCEDCWHGKWDVPTSDLVCEKGHKPRFYRMKSPLDQTFGFKRKCEDFVDKHVARHFEKEK